MIHYCELVPALILFIGIKNDTFFYKKKIMEQAKVFAKKLYNALLPHEKTILKIEDILCFNRPWYIGAILIFLANFVYILGCVFGFSTYSAILCFVAIFSTIKFWGPVVSKFLLSEELTDLPRFTLKEICAGAGTLAFLVATLRHTAIEGITKQHIMSMLITLFVLLLLFYLFLSIPDYIVGFLLMNGLLLAPYLKFKFNYKGLVSRYQNVVNKVGEVQEKLTGKSDDKQKVD